MPASSNVGRETTMDGILLRFLDLQGIIDETCQCFPCFHTVMFSKLNRVVSIPFFIPTITTPFFSPPPTPPTLLMMEKLNFEQGLFSLGLGCIFGILWFQYLIFISRCRSVWQGSLQNLRDAALKLRISSVKVLFLFQLTGLQRQSSCGIKCL